MAEFGKWISVEEELPEEVGIYLIIGTFGFIHDRKSDLCDHDEVTVGYFNPSFGWLADAPGFKKANYWMELPSFPNKGGDDK